MRTLPVLVVLAGLVAAASPTLAQPVDDGRPVKPAPGQPPAAAPVPSGARMVFESTNHDFGSIPDTAKVCHKFPFANKGTGTLVISNVHASCSCTAADPEKKEYAPGETGEIEVCFDPHGKNGPQNQTVTVSTNDDASPAIVLSISAAIRAAITIDPPIVDFGDVLRGTPASRTIKVVGRAKDFEATYASVARALLFRTEVLETKDVDVEGEKLRETTIEIKLTGSERLGGLQSVATIRTTDPENPLTSVQLQAAIVPDVRAIPPRVTFGVLEPGNPIDTKFRVNTRTNRSFKIVKVEQTGNIEPPLEITYEAVEGTDNKEYLVTVKGSAPAKRVAYQNMVKITTDLPDEPPIEVAVNGAIRAAPQLLEAPPTGPIGPDPGGSDKP